MEIAEPEARISVSIGYMNISKIANMCYYANMQYRFVLCLFVNAFMVELLKTWVQNLHGALPKRYLARIQCSGP